MQRGSIPSCLLAIDAEKAFDRVGWSFLKETLALEAKSFLKWKRCGDTRIVETMVGNRILPLEAMGEEHKKEWMQHGLLQRYISSLIKEAVIDRPLTALEKILIQEPYLRSINI